MQQETKAIRYQSKRTQYGEHSTPLYLTSSFVFDDVQQMEDAFHGKVQREVYSRYGNPNVQELIDKVCQMEGAETGLATASGMASVFATFGALLQAGDHVLASSALFGSAYKILEQILSKWGITHDYVEPEDLEAWKNKIRPNTKLIFLETPSNPMLRLVDIEAVSQLAKANNSILVVDNCFASPYLQNPILFGADLVLHSSTKYMDGQGRVLGGMIVGRTDLIEEIQFFIRHTGPSLSPFNAWVISKSLETLALRMEKHCANALAIAQWLEQHPKVDRVLYPFLDSHPQQKLAQKQMKLGGGIVSFELKGDGNTVKAFIDRTNLFSITSNLGDSRSILTHPVSSSLAKTPVEKRLQFGVKDNLIRISVGLENEEDLIKDLENAF
ncbi:MAG: O-succinylhomoserine sulfhydrylase [Bacteroidota bacterium]